MQRSEKITTLAEQYEQPAGPTTPEGLYCMDLFLEYSQSGYKTKKMKQIKAGRERYHNRGMDFRGPWEGSSKRSLGLTRIAVDKLEPRVMKRMVADDDFIQVDPVGADDLEYSKHVKQFLQWAVRSNIKIKSAMRPHIKDLLFDGTKDIIPIWDEDTTTVRRRRIVPTFMGPRGPVPPQMAAQMAKAKKQNPEQFQQMAQKMGFREGPPQEMESEEMESTSFRVKWEGIDLAESFFPDDGKPFEDQPFLRWIYINIEELKDLEQDGPYKNISDGLAPIMQSADRHEEHQTDTQNKGISYSAYAREAKLLECFIRWDGEWRICTFCPDFGWIEVRNQPMRDVYWHGKKPIIRTTIYRDSDESMGNGIPEIIAHFHTGLNAMWNQMIDYGTVEIMPQGFYNQGSIGMRGKVIKGKPGSLTPIPHDSKIHFPNIPTKSPILIQFIELLMTFFERTLSIMDYNMGRASGSTGKGGDTAAGMSMIVQEGEISHNYLGDGIAMSYEELLKQTLFLYAQYIPLGFTMNLFEGNQWLFQAVDIEALQGGFDIKVKISDKSNNDHINKQNKVAMLQLLSKLPGMNIRKLVEQVLEADGKKDIDEFFMPQFNLLQQALQVGGDELVQLLQQFLQQKEQQGKEEKIAQQAKDNNLRQHIERQHEDESLENAKLVDRGKEKVKRQVIDEILAQTGGRIQ